MAVVTYTSDELGVAEVAAALERVGFEVGRARRVERRLLDTFDGRLHAAGLRLELRTGERKELVVHGPGEARAQVDIGQQPRLAGDLPAGPVRTRLSDLLEVRALLAVVAVEGMEVLAARRNAEGKVVVAATLYHRPALAGDGQVVAPVAAELRVLEGYAKPGARAADLFTDLRMERHNRLLVELAADKAGVDLLGFAGSPTVALDPAEPALDGFLRVLANLARSVAANLPGTIDDLDPEFLHDLRVAVRRTRSVLAQGKRVLPGHGRDHFRGEFRWLGQVTSPQRDLDVYVIEWPGYVAPLGPEAADSLAPVLELIRQRRVEAHDALVHHLRSARYEQLMQAWSAWLDAPGPAGKGGKQAQKPLGFIVADRLAQAQDRVLARGRQLGPASAAEDLHELRKDAKRLRYLFECFGTLLPSGPRKSFVSRLKSLQDNLGEHQDSEVHSTELRRLSADVHASAGVSADTMLAMGRLTELFEQRRQAARRAFAERFAGYDTKATARALDDVLAALRSS